MSIQDRLTEQEDRLAEQEDRLAKLDRRLAEQEDRLAKLERLVGENRFTKKDYPEFVNPPRLEPVWGPDKPWKTKESYENAIQVAMAEKQRRLAQPS
jgi:uncharacterized coiled-coil protein SlyX